MTITQKVLCTILAGAALGGSEAMAAGSVAENRAPRENSVYTQANPASKTIVTTIASRFGGPGDLDATNTITLNCELGIVTMMDVPSRTQSSVLISQSGGYNTAALMTAREKCKAYKLTPGF